MEEPRCIFQIWRTSKLRDIWGSLEEALNSVRVFETETGGKGIPEEVLRKSWGSLGEFLRKFQSQSESAVGVFWNCSGLLIKKRKPDGTGL